MRILICTDGATKVPKEVASKEEAQAYIDRGFTVEFVDQPVVETKVYEDGTEATGVAPLPEKSPTAPAKKAAKKTAAKKAK